MRGCRLVVLLALLVPAAAAAQPKDQAAARAHFKKGEEHFHAGELNQAIDEYQATYDILEAPILLFDIALCHQKLGNREKAVALYHRYLAADPGGKKSVEARTRLAALERELAEAKKQREEAAAAELTRRRGEVERLRQSGPPAELARALAALAEIDRDPELIFELAEAERRAGQRDAAIRAYNRYLSRKDVRRAEEARRRRGELERPEKTAPENTPPENTPPAGGQKTALPPPHQPERPSLIPPIAASGGAAVALAVGLVFGSSAKSTQSELEDQLDNLQPPLDSGDTRIDDGRRAALFADISFGVGAAAALAAGYLWWRYLHSGDGGEAPRAMVVPQRRGAGIEVRW